jgi:phenylacetate-CoA ligase
LERFRPDYVIGYSVALDLFARAVPDARSSLRAIGVRLVIAAAEGFPSPDSETRISDLFGCPVAMEYGAVETNLVAHTHPEGGYRAFWRSYLLEADEVNGRFPLRITSLYPRCTPLLRYEIGDEIDPWPDSPRIGLSSFRRVIGRCNDYVVLGDGRPIHSEAFTHAVRSCATIRAYQVVQTGPRIELRVLSERELATEEEDGVRARLGKIEPALARIEIVRSEALERTIAGKTPMILRRP